MNDQSLEARLLAAHDVDDRWALVDLYDEASKMNLGIENASFFLTHAWVFALEVNHPKAAVLKARLVECGRV